jgi:predicted molibdopterin-dependent oxidoreductase YjgC
MLFIHPTRTLSLHNSKWFQQNRSFIKKEDWFIEIGHFEWRNRVSSSIRVAEQRTEDKITVSEKTAARSIRRGNFTDLNSVCSKVLVTVKITNQVECLLKFMPKTINGIWSKLNGYAEVSQRHNHPNWMVMPKTCRQRHNHPSWMAGNGENIQLGINI